MRFEHEDVIDAKSQRHFTQREHGAQKQTAGHQQGKSERQLQNNQGALYAMLLTAGAGLRSILTQGLIDRDGCGQVQWEQREEQRTQDTEREQGAQNADVRAERERCAQLSC